MFQFLILKKIAILCIIAVVFFHSSLYVYAAKLESPNYTLQLQDVSFEKDTLMETTTDIETVLGKASRT